MLMGAKIANLLHSISYKQIFGMRHELVYQMGAKWEREKALIIESHESERGRSLFRKRFQVHRFMQM